MGTKFYLKKLMPIQNEFTRRLWELIKQFLGLQVLNLTSKVLACLSVHVTMRVRQ